MSDSLWPHELQHAKASLSTTNSRSLLKLMSIESVMPSNHLILCHLLLLLPWIFPSIRVFSNELALHIRWLKYWSFSFSISPINEYSGLISFRIDWFDLLVIQASLIQHNSSLWHTQEAQHNMPGLLWVKHRVSGPLLYSATGKTKVLLYKKCLKLPFLTQHFHIKACIACWKRALQ